MSSTNNISQELKDLGIDIPNHGFTSDDELKDYFNQFSPQLLEKIKLEAYIDTLPKHMPYLLPVNYLNEFTAAHLLAESKEVTLHKTTRLNISYIKISAVAASIALVIGSFWYFSKTEQPVSLTHNSINSSIAPTTTPKEVVTQIAMASISKTEATEFVQNNIEEYELEDLNTDFIADNSNNVNQKSTATVGIEEPSSDEIKAYLQEESIDELL